MILVRVEAARATASVVIFASLLLCNVLSSTTVHVLASAVLVSNVTMSRGGYFMYLII